MDLTGAAWRKAPRSATGPALIFTAAQQREPTAALRDGAA